MKNDQKKVLLVGGLALVLVAIGAFQFVPKKKSPAPVETEKPAVAASTGDASAAETGEDGQKKLDPQREALLAMVSPLSKRDPFAPQTPQEASEPVQQAPVAQKAPSQPPRDYASNGASTGRLPGNVPPFDPTQGGTLPPVGDTSAGIGIENGKPLRQPGELTYEVKGVLVGDKPLAVFEDDDGNQRLVPLGGSLDRDSKVVGIEKGKVRIRHRGKEKTLRLPEGP